MSPLDSGIYGLVVINNLAEFTQEKITNKLTRFLIHLTRSATSSPAIQFQVLGFQWNTYGFRVSSFICRRPDTWRFHDHIVYDTWKSKYIFVK